EVVGIGELFHAVGDEFAQRHLGFVFAVEVWIGVAVLDSVHIESMEMATVPRHAVLDDLVQFPERAVAHFQAPPDRRANARQGDPRLVYRPTSCPALLTSVFTPRIFLLRSSRAGALSLP